MGISTRGRQPQPVSGTINVPGHKEHAKRIWNWRPRRMGEPVRKRQVLPLCGGRPVITCRLLPTTEWE